MTWTKLDDGFWTNPKVMAAGNEVAGAYCRMLSYCGHALTEGKVPDSIARVIAKPGLLKRMEQHGFITRNGVGWEIPDYLEFNLPAAKVKAKRRVRAEAGRRGGLASAESRRAS